MSSAYLWPPVSRLLSSSRTLQILLRHTSSPLQPYSYCHFCQTRPTGTVARMLNGRGDPSFGRPCLRGCVIARPLVFRRRGLLTGVMNRAGVQTRQPAFGIGTTPTNIALLAALVISIPLILAARTRKFGSNGPLPSPSLPPLCFYHLWLCRRSYAAGPARTPSSETSSLHACRGVGRSG